MKTSRILISILLLACFAASCGTEPGGKTPEPETVTPGLATTLSEAWVYNHSLDIPTVVEFNVTELQDDGIVEASAQNADVTTDFDRNTGKGIATVVAKESFDTSGILKISARNEDKDTTVTVVLKKIIVNTSTTKMQFPKVGGTGVFTITSNVKYTVSSPDEWVEISPIEGEEGRWSVVVAANPKKELRKSSVEVKDEAGVTVAGFPVSQEPADMNAAEMTEYEALVAIFQKCSHRDVTGTPIEKLANCLTINGETHVVKLQIGKGYPADNFYGDIEIPEEIGELRYLRELEIEGTNEADKYGHIVGTLPKNLGNLRDLKRIMIYNTSLTGDLPDWMANFKDIREIDITSNYFTGNLPLWLADLEKLESFRFCWNCYDGKINESLTNTKWWNVPCAGTGYDNEGNPWYGQPMGLVDLKTGQREGHKLYL